MVISMATQITSLTIRQQIIRTKSLGEQTKTLLFQAGTVRFGFCLEGQVDIGEKMWTRKH